MASITERLATTYIENSDFRKLIPAWDSPDALFYLDPPYLLEEKLYAFDFKESDHFDLREVIENIKGKVILSYNDSRQARKLYKGFKISSTKQVHYCMNNKRSTSR